MFPFVWKVVVHPKPCLILTTTSCNREASCCYPPLAGCGPVFLGLSETLEHLLNTIEALPICPHPPKISIGAKSFQLEHSLGRKLRGFSIGVPRRYSLICADTSCRVPTKTPVPAPCHL